MPNKIDDKIRQDFYRVKIIFKNERYSDILDFFPGEKREKSESKRILHYPNI